MTRLISPSSAFTAILLVVLIGGLSGCSQDPTSGGTHALPPVTPALNSSADQPAIQFVADKTKPKKRRTSAKLKCGAAEVIITQIKDRPEVYADLYARAFVIANKFRRLVIVSADVGTFSYQEVDLFLKHINTATGIPPENIIICSSQTHNAPGVDGRHMTEESRQWLAGAMAGIVKTAVENLQPAKLRVSREPVQIGYNRRIMRDGRVVMGANPDGVVVPWVDVLAAYGRDKKRIGVVFSHAAHAVIVHNSSKAIGPDYPGFAVSHLRSLLTAKGEPDGVFMYIQGCGGNVNGFPLRGGIPACNAAGLSLAFAISQALADDKTFSSGRLRARSMDLTLPFADPPSVEECKKVLSAKPDNRRYQSLLKLAESGERPKFRFPMRALAIGDDLCILAFAGEMFAEYQLFVEKVSPFKHNFVLIHANGRFGYVATKKDYELGDRAGYEAWGLPTRGHPFLPPHASVEKQIQEGVVRLLKELKKDRGR